MNAASVPLVTLALLAPMTGTDGPGDLPRDDLPEELPRTAPRGLAPWSAPEDDAAVALGRRLFFDPILSRDRTVSCASCHRPDHGFADPRPLSEGVESRITPRHAPTLLNRAFGTSFFWDGRVSTLEEQVLQPVQNELEMDLALDEAVARLVGDGAYADAFAEVYGGAPTSELLGQALAAFVRRLFLGDSPVDHFRENDRGALSPAERSGFWFYASRRRCWRCHSGPNFTDEDFHNTGVGAADGAPREGRFAVTAEEADRGRFKTPTLRGVALTAPYMHDGSLATLEEVVEFYRKGGVSNSHLDEVMEPIEMSDEDAANLVAFLKALSRVAE